MKALDEFKETLSRFDSAVDAIKAASDSKTVSAKEMEAVRILQLLEAQIGFIGQDLYQLVTSRRVAIQRGIVREGEKVSEDNKSSNSGRPKRQSNRKTKRASE